MNARTNRIIPLLIVAFVLVTIAPTFAGSIIYVDANAIGANDGSSWADAYNYLQDLSQPHLVFIQPQPGTKFIPGDTSIGTWDPVNRIYTLTADVYETIQIDEDNLTLDGAGHTVTGSGGSFGVYLPERTGVTIKNVNVRQFTYGIYLYHSSNNTLTANNVTNINFSGFNGIYLYHSDNNILTGNTGSSTGHSGIALSYSNNNTLRDNIGTWNIDDSGIELYRSTGNTLTGNRVSDNWRGISIGYDSSNNTVTGNIASNNSSGYAITIYASDNTLTGNISSSNSNGITVFWSSNNTLTGNSLISNSQFGMILYGHCDWGYSINNQIYNNNFIENGTQAQISFIEWHQGPYPPGGSVNVFNLDKAIGGNYWSDWTSPDDDGDGFVDYPYVFDGGQDNLPWTRPDGWLPSEPRELYVDDDATGNNNGSSWEDAYNFLQDALAVALSGDEIWVAQGTYRPDEYTAHPSGTGSLIATFQLKNGVAIYGGYAGFGEPNPDGRDVDVYETILSGDLSGNDVPVPDPYDLPTEPTRVENSYHVVTGDGTDATAVLDGFTVTAGNAIGGVWWGSEAKGGGMHNFSGDPTVTNCKFSGNAASNEGGGMYNYNCSPTLTNCTFIGNSAGNIDTYTYSIGGGICNDEYCSPTVTACTFTGNSAKRGGGIANLDGCHPTLINCTFTGNSTKGTNGGYGSGIYSNLDCRLTVTNCTFNGNSAEVHGGGIYSDRYSNPTVTNCIFWGNIDSGGSDELAQIYGDPPVINYCCVQGWTGVLGGTGNIGTDPLFVDIANSDYRLQSNSPCIDVGENTAVPPEVVTDLDGNPRIANGTVDMGAYEFFSLEVAIDIKPGSYPNAINLGSYGLVPVAILSSEDFDATTIDPNTIELALATVAVRGKSNKFMAHQEDVNGDGLVDLLLQVANKDLVPNSFQDGYAVLTGETYDGVSIKGEDEITIVPPEP